MEYVLMMMMMMIIIIIIIIIVLPILTCAVTRKIDSMYERRDWRHIQELARLFITVKSRPAAVHVLSQIWSCYGGKPNVAVTFLNTIHCDQEFGSVYRSRLAKSYYLLK